MASAAWRHNAPMRSIPGPAPQRARARSRKGRRWLVALWLLPVLGLHALALLALARLAGPQPDSLPPVLYTRVLLPRSPTVAQQTPARAAPRALPRNPATRPPPARPGTATLLTAAAPAASHPASHPASRTASRTASPAASHATSRAAPGRAPSTEPAASQAAAPRPGASAASAAHPRASAPAAAPQPPAAASPESAAAAAPAGASAARSAPEPAWPPSTRLEFRLTGYYRGALHGSGSLEWRRLGDAYQLRLAGSALIDFSYTSSGRIDGPWLAPERYVEQVLLRSKTVEFDRRAGLLRFSAMPATLPIPAHLQDSASVFMQLAERLRSRPQDFVDGAKVALQVARPTGTTTWVFRVVGHDTVATGAGRLACWHLDYTPPPGADLGAEVWLAPELQDLPVQIRLRRSATEYLLFTLERALQQAPAASAPSGSR